MPALAEIQLLFRNAVVTDDKHILPLLAGGSDPRKGLAIHHRNYESSLTTALLTKFPATVWLAGSAFVTEAARQFIRRHPPSVPCIAEYGEAFPRFLASLPAAARMPYLGEFADLERLVGQVSIDIDEPCLSAEKLSQIGEEVLPDLVLTLQTGVAYRETLWPVDDLLKLYLAEASPYQYALDPADLWIEVRGARGEFRIERLDPLEFIFRKSIREGYSIGAAAEFVLQADAAFDPGLALARLLSAGLAIGVRENGGQP